MGNIAERAQNPAATGYFAPLRDERFINFATFKRNGDAVETPVWFAEHLGTLYLFSAGNAGKVKRLRNSPRSRVAACNARGKLRGSWLATTACILNEEQDKRTAHTALLNKYGWQMRLGDWLAQLSGRAERRAYLAVVSTVVRPDRPAP